MAHDSHRHLQEPVVRPHEERFQRPGGPARGRPMDIQLGHVDHGRAPDGVLRLPPCYVPEQGGVHGRIFRVDRGDLPGVDRNLPRGDLSARLRLHVVLRPDGRRHRDLGHRGHRRARSRHRRRITDPRRRCANHSADRQVAVISGPRGLRNFGHRRVGHRGGAARQSASTVLCR